MPAAGVSTSGVEEEPGDASLELRSGQGRRGRVRHSPSSPTSVYRGVSQNPVITSFSRRGKAPPSRSPPKRQCVSSRPVPERRSQADLRAAWADGQRSSVPLTRAVGGPRGPGAP